MGKLTGDPDRTFGIENWDGAGERVRAILVRTAQARTVIPYSTLAAEAYVGDPHGPGLAYLLGEVSTLEHAEGRPLLSAVAVYKDQTNVGSGFFEIANQLELLTSNSPRARDQFWLNELRRCWDYHTLAVPRIHR